MHNKNYSREKASSMLSGLTKGAIVSLVITIALSAILAWLVRDEIIEEGKIGYGVMSVLTIASFLGAETASKKIQRRVLQVCAMSAVIYFAILLSITALFFGGQYSGVGETALMVICGSMLSALWESRGRKEKKRYKTYGVHR